MSDNIIEFNSGQRPPTPPADSVIADSLELLRIFLRIEDPAQRRAIIQMLDYMAPEGSDPALSDGIYPP